MDKTWRQWFQENFNVVVLVVLYLVMIHWEIYRGKDTYLQNSASQVLSALFGIMVGAGATPLPKKIDSHDVSVTKIDGGENKS